MRVASYQTTLKRSRQVERFRTSYFHPLQRYSGVTVHWKSFRVLYIGHIVQVLSKMQIEIEPTFQHVTWIVRDFLKLSQESGSFLDSPEFLCSGDRYCMRLYPKGENTHGRCTSFHVRRLTVTFPEREVSCDIGIRTREPDGDECYRCSSVSLEVNGSWKRSFIEKYRDVYVPGGNLTVICRLWLREECTAGSSARGEEARGGFPGHCDPFSSRWNSPKMELITEFPCTRVKLTVPDVFELLKETGDSPTSPEFRFAGDTYCFRFRPNGATADTDLELVRLTSAFAENTVFYRVGYAWGWPTYPNDARPLVGSRGFCLSRSKLEEEREKYAPRGTLRLVLFLRLGERGSAGAGTSDVARERRGSIDVEKLQSDFRQLLEKKTESDARFVVRKKEFPVHRNVLRARSDVFEAMFGHDTAERKSGMVEVEDLDPDTFGHFLEYLYTGDVQAGLSDDNAFGLYVAADKYGVSTLKSKCADYMRRSLSVDSFCDVVSLALRHGEEELLQQATRFYKDNMPAIVITVKWQQFMCDNPTSANELLIKAVVPGKH